MPVDVENWLGTGGKNGHKLYKRHLETLHKHGLIERLAVSGAATSSNSRLYFIDYERFVDVVRFKIRDVVSSFRHTDTTRRNKYRCPKCGTLTPGGAIALVCRRRDCKVTLEPRHSLLGQALIEKGFGTSLAVSDLTKIAELAQKVVDGAKAVAGGLRLLNNRPPKHMLVSGNRDEVDAKFLGGMGRAVPGTRRLPPTVFDDVEMEAPGDAYAGPEIELEIEYE